MAYSANTSEATVISLESHPVWSAAQRREQQRKQDMLRHPAFLAQQRAATAGADVGMASAPGLSLCHSVEAPA